MALDVFGPGNRQRSRRSQCERDWMHGCMPLPVYRPAADRNGTKRRETAAQRGSGAPRPSAAVSATDLASLAAIVSLLRARVRRVQRGIVFVVSLARPPFRRPHLARGSACSSKSANWATAKLGQPPRTTTIDSPAKFQRCTICTSEAMLRHVLQIAPGAALQSSPPRRLIGHPVDRGTRKSTRRN
jgi:hypothetical protein